MKRRLFNLVAFSLAVLCISTPLLAQTVRVNIPGTAFSPQERGVRVDDVAGGRRFRGQPFARVTLRAVLQMPASGAAEPRMQRLVIHFRTSPSGPSLRSVELLSPGSTTKRFHIDTQLTGNYIATEITKPEIVANVWNCGRSPIEVSPQSVLRLEVVFPGGFDSKINPGEFFLTAVGIDFPSKALSGKRAEGQTLGKGPRARPSAC